MSEPKPASSEVVPAVPFPACLKFDVLAGFLVFLIALPLCLAIANASQFPPIGGVITAIVGGIVASLISNSELTIKGPAAGLIAIIAGCVIDMRTLDPSGPFPGYRLALAVGVFAAVLQILFGIFKAGKLGDFFPTAVVHGLLASIGVIIMIKSFLAMLGVTAPLPKENTQLLAQYPHFISLYNLPIAIIGLASLALMIFYPMIKLKAFKMIPVQAIVLVVAIPLSLYLGLVQSSTKSVAAAPAAASASASATASAEAKLATAAKPVAVLAAHPTTTPPAELLDPNHSITMNGKPWSLNPAKFLINVPLDFTHAIVFPDFKQVFEGGAGTKFIFWQWVAMFAIIGSLESLLSAKAVDLIDPQRRKTNLNLDILGVGVANLVSSCLGGLPMISEIVRSRANVDNGAKTRLSNVSHSLFLLLSVAMLPFVVNMIPIAALSAMLVYTGFRLAHPREFLHTYKVGTEQLVVFLTTIVAIICTDLLTGALIGLAVELGINLVNGLPITSVFSAGAEVKELETGRFVVTPHNAAVFSNWLSIRSKVEALAANENCNVVVDLSQTRLVDHTVMERLHEVQREFRQKGHTLEIIGLERHAAFSQHPYAARKALATA